MNKKLDDEYRTALLIMLSSLFILVFTSLLAFIGPKSQNLEGRITLAIYHWPLSLRPYFYAITQLGSGWAVAVTALALWSLKRRVLAYTVTFASIFTFAWAELLKTIIERPRPYMALNGVISRDMFTGGFGFPSGHAAMYTMLVVLLWGVVSPRARPVLPLLAVGVCVSRLYLGVHSPLDIIGGISLGLCVGLAIKMPWLKIKSSLARYGIKA